MLRFKCVTCDEWHEGMPTYGADAPYYYYAIAADERAARCELGSDQCIIDGRWYFVRGCLEIPVHGKPDPFVWGVWVSLSEANFERFSQLMGVAKRSHERPFFGWLSTDLSPHYPSTLNLKTNVRIRDDGIRPLIEVEPTDHPLALEQRDGVPVARVAAIHACFAHGDASPQDGRV